jgi:hypothetical protein
MSKVRAKRVLLLPDDYRLWMQLGWMIGGTFLPDGDEPVIGAGIFLPVEESLDTPTMPPAAYEPGAGAETSTASRLALIGRPVRENAT